MSGNLNDYFHHSSPMKRTRDLINSEKQGIGTILRSDSERFRVANSLRRTLSADMSSTNWLSQQSSSPIKKVASSAEISVSGPDSLSGDEDYDERRGEFDIWKEIQENKAKETVKPGQFQIWSSILSQKVDEESKSLPPYIHPLVKTSSSSLNEKSLEICTESLGSETGSDGFSSYTESENGEIEDEKKESPKIERQSFSSEEWSPVKYNYRKSPSRSFPPPLSSLSRRDGDSVRMLFHRDNGRLVLEAVAVPSQNNFQAKREDGRLVLSFVNPNEFVRECEINDEDEEEDEFEEQFVESDEEEEEEEEEDEEEQEEIERSTIRVNEIEIVTEQPSKFSSGHSNIHRLARSMNKWTGFSNMNGACSNKEEKLAEQRWLNPVAQSLPPRPQVARRVTSPEVVSAAAMAATSLNDYEYPWRSIGAGYKQGNSLTAIKQQSPSMNNSWSNGRRNHGEDKAIPFSNGCKQPRRSLLWEPHCIAT